MTAATLVLLRHATTRTTGKRLGGRKPGFHLDDRGRGQAEAAARRLAQLPVAAVYTSPLERTRETAAPVARAHGLRPRIERGLLEVDYGDWTDLPLAQLRRRALWRTIQQAPSRVTFPGGESIRAAQQRVVEATERLAAAHVGETIVLVSHADVIKAAIAHHRGMGLDLFQRLVISPASSSVLVLPDGGAPALVTMNDTSDPASSD